MLHFLTIVLLSLSFAKAPDSLYDVQVKDISGKPVVMSQYKGKVLLIVNTASQCGFTPQLKDLETLYKKYKGKGFEVLAFPSNDFKQDPAANSEIASYAQKNYEVTFPFFEKGSVTGDQKQLLFQVLTKQRSGGLFKEVHWNFEKFLVGRDGKLISHWNSLVSPTSEDIVKPIEAALSSNTVGKEKK